ncbi:hypothetical protein [Methanosphaera cuniculi]|uniref:Uncharacterized protein n=1 Tax=Methanosphaera cuniculi TaxID=1077256 RepID=A0A2V2BLU4_9EURY|nr:hypothetical protein [Methanosphaera cuniculi]PWL08726.1 hypothetical protein MSCUN_04390 [Methanosphaera cuniculi]
MNKNSKYLFLGLTLLILLISVGSISATDNTTSTTEQISTTDTLNDVVTTINPKIEDKKLETNKTNKINKINSKKETKTINTNKSVKKQTTHIVTNSTVTQYFDKNNNYTLSSSVADGDTLDIQGNISNLDDKDFNDH